MFLFMFLFRILKQQTTLDDNAFGRDLENSSTRCMYICILNLTSNPNSIPTLKRKDVAVDFNNNLIFGSWDLLRTLDILY